MVVPPYFSLMRTVLLLLCLATPLAAQAREREFRDLVARSLPYAPLPEYRDWWTETVTQCDCIPQVQSWDLQWRLMADSRPHERGAYWSLVNVIFIEPPDDRNPEVVKHEMLHAILGGDPNHTAAVWRRFHVTTY